MGRSRASGAEAKSVDEDDEEVQKLRAAIDATVVRSSVKVKWSDVAGLDVAKGILKDAVIMPTLFPQAFKGARKPPKGILLYGPPGTGKSFLAKAVATEATSVFFSVKASDLKSKWTGETEKHIKTLFERAREAEKAVIFVDEVDSLCSERSQGDSSGDSSSVQEFLAQMDGVGASNTGVLVLAATNLPWVIDAAMLRRFEKRIYTSRSRRRAPART